MKNVSRPPGRSLGNLFRNCVEHGSTSSRTASDDSVEHGSTGNRPRADDSAERSSAGDRTEFDNTVKHDGDDVTVTVGPTDDGEGFYLEDDGTGIDPEARDRIFESGYSGGSGTGLGLAIVERIADAHGWEVTATDSETGGARFVVSGVDPAGG